VEPIVVEVTRGDVVEARHVVHAVAVREGCTEVVYGDPGLVSFLRSSAKPIQALPVVRARPDLDDEQIALLCASHRATPEQLEVVRGILDDAPATEGDLECGPDPTRIEHNCSGKHAGFLALCRASGWPIAGYRLAGHPCQEAVRTAVAECLDVERSSLVTAIDGCGVPTYAATLEAAADAFARLPALDGGDRVVHAMRRHAELLRGPVAADALLTRSLDGWFAKGGAEGLLCAASSDGLGLALKVADGAYRAMLPALATVLGRLGIDTRELGAEPLRNSRGEVVGNLRIASPG
jgi:L-asparaginase II